MNTYTLDKFLRVQELAEADLEYQGLLQELRSLDSLLLDVFAHLPERDCAAVMDYVGTFCALQMRFVEIACDRMEFPDIV